jgi:serine/threonine protein kinase
MDIKPQNMLYKFVPGNMYPQIVLSDFGSCVDAKTKINGDIGTRGYSAPEVEQATKVAGIFKERAYYMPIHADAFSWALSMMDIIHPSSYSKNLYEKIQKLEERNPSTQNLHGMELKIFQKMTKIMQKNPKDRYKLFRNIQRLLPSPQLTLQT